MAFTTLAILKPHLEIESTDTEEDIFLNQLILQIENAMATRFGRTLSSTVYTAEYQSGDGSEWLQLDQWPITAVASVSIDQQGFWGHGTSAFPADSLLTLGTDYAPPSFAENEGDNAGRLFRISSKYWPEGNGNIKISYTAGYTSMPKQLELLANQLCALVRNGAEYGGLLESGKVGDEAFKLLGKAAEGSKILWAVEAVNILSGYQRIAI